MEIMLVVMKMCMRRVTPLFESRIIEHVIEILAR